MAAAKLNSARQSLTEQRPQETVQELPQPQPQPEPAADDNPVGRLQELCQRQLWPLPVYAFVCTGGDNPARRQFTCSAQLLGRSERGVGASKRLAKRSAAALLFRQLRATPPTAAAAATPAASERTTEAAASLDEANFQRLRASKKLQSAARAGAEVCGIFRGVRNRKAGSTLPPMEAPTLPPPAADAAGGSISACEQLLELGRTHRFGVQFLDDQALSCPGGAGVPRCVVKLATMPTIVVVGNGVNAADSREQACRAAMDYLCLLTRENPSAATKK